MSDSILPDENRWTVARLRMVERQIRRRGIRDERVLSAMRLVERHAFVPSNLHGAAYDDSPLPIGFGQTISQPFTVAFMCAALQLQGNERVLEVGAGSGYGAAVLSRIAREVHSIERIASLATRARKVLATLGFTNATIHAGDGTLGLVSHAPFDAIIVTAGAVSLPTAYLDQLAVEGRIIIPLGDRPRSQTMHRFTRKAGQLHVDNLGGFAFVPLVGEHGWEEGACE